MTALFIGRASMLTGASIKAIRHYEALGLIAPPQRQGKYRVYSAATLEFIRHIKCAQQLGFTLLELKNSLQENTAGQFCLERVQQGIHGKKMQLQQKINALQLLHQQLDEFEEALPQMGPNCV